MLACAARAISLPLLALLMAVPLRAQGEEALSTPRGMISAGVAGVFTYFDELFGAEPALGARFATPIAGSFFTATGAVQPVLQSFFDATAGRTGRGPFSVGADALRLGALTPDLSAEQRYARIDARVGLTSWLDVGVTVPVEWRRTEVRGVYLADAAFGPNPDPARNQALLARIDSAYAAVGASTYLPLADSPAGRELLARYEQMRASGDTAMLLLPQRGLNQAEFAQLLADEGRGRFPFATDTRPYRPGDVELSARVRLLNTTRTRLRPGVRRRGVRLLAEVGARLPTGRGADVDSLLAIPAESGNAGLSGTLTADWFAGRLWVSANAATTRFTATKVIRRGWTPGNPFDTLGTPQLVRRTPGQAVQLALTPRYRLTDEISLAARYAYARVGATTFDGADASDFAGIETTAATRVQRLGFGIGYSTLAAYERGTAAVPYDLSLLYERAFSGSSGAPRTARVTVAGRIFTRAWGRARRQAPAPQPAAATR